MQQEEGRIRWAQKRNNTNGTIYYAFEYDYYLRDHLNNVRAVITEGKDTATYAATMESADSVVVQKLFSNVYDLVRTVSAKPAAFDGNSGNVYVSKLTGNPPSGGQGGRIGPSLVLKVMAGDKVQINTFAYYNGATQTPVTDNTLLTDLLSTLVSGITSQSGDKIGSGNSTALSNAVSPNVLSFLNNRTYSSSLPKAYLNWVLLDNQFKYVASNSSAMQVQPGSSKQPLVAPLQTMAKNGYLYVYVSNQSPQDVYFDDLIVNHYTGPLVQEQSYYPFGLQMAGISDKAMIKMDSKNKFNGGVELEEDYGVNLYSTFYREYDPQIGRFGGVDVLSERTNSLSAYHFSNNNPISFNDPSGALFNHTDPFGRPIYSVEERFNNFEMTLISEGRSGGGGGGSVSAVDGNFNFSGTAAQEVLKDIQYSYNHPDKDGNSFIDFGTNSDGSVYTQSTYDSPNQEDGLNDNGNGYREQTIFFHRTQYAYLPVEDMGAWQGVYHIDGFIQITQTLNYGKYLKSFATVSATGSTPASSVGEVNFYGTADLVVGGKNVSSQDFVRNEGPSLKQTDTFPLGTTTFVLPVVNNVVQIIVNAGYFFTNETGNGGTPIPPLTHITINIPH